MTAVTSRRYYVRTATAPYSDSTAKASIPNGIVPLSLRSSASFGCILYPFVFPFLLLYFLTPFTADPLVRRCFHRYHRSLSSRRVNISPNIALTRSIWTSNREDDGFPSLPQRATDILSVRGLSRHSGRLYWYVEPTIRNQGSRSQESAIHHQSHLAIHMETDSRCLTTRFVILYSSISSENRVDTALVLLHNQRRSSSEYHTPKDHRCGVLRHNDDIDTSAENDQAPRPICHT